MFGLVGIWPEKGAVSLSLEKPIVYGDFTLWLALFYRDSRSVYAVLLQTSIVVPLPPPSITSYD